MSNANELKTKFTNLLKEMFQLDQPELDFGIYRIMHARKDDINRFIEQDLPKKIADAFAGFQGMDKQQVAQDLEKAKKSAIEAGFEPSQSPKVQELEAQYNAQVDLSREEGEVYDALVTFFERYYDEGDFISRRIYKDGTYAIPYSGEEVMLHWANKDQYYIKSSVNLRDYAFRLNPHDPQNPMRVHFKLVDAKPDPNSNNKEAEGKNRVFVLKKSDENNQAWSEVKVENREQQITELEIYFEYRAATDNDWTPSAKSSATTAAKQKPPTQDHLRQIAVEQLLQDARLPAHWKTPLSQAYTKANGEKADYSNLQGQINNYTKANKFDYFIHKDLGKFLRQELDFYIKNELIRWEDIAANKANFAKLGPMFSKIEVIRQLGETIITFLAQLEDFQKKLWLKKKFVTETQYCITLDKLENQPGLVEIALNNPTQREEWVELFGIDLNELDQVKAQAIEAVLAHQNYRYLVIDTGVKSKTGELAYTDEFKAKLVASIEDLDEQINGLLIHSENFQALNLLQDKYREKVKCIYIDPPYNTGGDGFIYKDNYQNSTWASFMYDRLFFLKRFLKDDGALFASIDDNEAQNLKWLCDLVFGSENLLTPFYLQVRYANKTLSEDNDFQKTIEQVLFYAKNKKLFKPIKDLTDYPTHKFQWKITELAPSTTFEAGGKKCSVFYPGQFRIEKIEPSLEGLKETWATGSLLRQKGSSGEFFGLHLATRKEEDGLGCLYRVEGIGEDGLGYRYFTGPQKSTATKGKFFSGIPLQTLQKINNGEALKELPIHNFMDFSGEFGNCRHEGKVDIQGGKKPEKLIERLINFVSGDEFDLVLDVFSGSGTTPAVAKKVGKKFIAVEQGSYFDEKSLIRLKNTLFGVSGGLDEKPSGFVKYIRLESYEDTLGNLALSRPNPIQSDMFDSANPSVQSAREDYLMNYMLEVESRGSASLLNISQFLDPMAYQLKVRSASGDETKLVNVDLIETFNWLLGLTVSQITAPVYFNAEFSQTDLGKWSAAVKRYKTTPQNHQAWWFRTVEGYNRQGQRVVIVWRNLPKTAAGDDKGLVLDNAVLQAVMLHKLDIGLSESPDDDIDLVYVNGDHNIIVPKRKDGELLEARVQGIEETFHRLMFATDEGTLM